MDTKEDKHPVAVVRTCSEADQGVMFPPVDIFLLHTAQNRNLWYQKAENLWTNPTVHFQVFQEGTKAHEELGSRTWMYTGMMIDDEPQMSLVERKEPLKSENNVKGKRNEVHITGTAEAQIQHTATSLQRVPHP